MKITDLAQPDVAKKLIKDLGGQTEVAALLGYERRKGGVKVGQWINDGVPDKIALHYGAKLLKEQRRVLRKQALAQQTIAQAATK